MPAFEEPSIGQDEQARELQAREQERVRLAQLAAMDREAAERDAQLALAAAQREAFLYRVGPTLLDMNLAAMVLEYYTVEEASGSDPGRVN